MARRTLFDIILVTLFRTCRPLYLLVVPVASFVFTWLFLAAPGIAVMSRTVDLPRAVTVELGLLLMGTTAIALTLATVTTPASVREPIRRHLRHEPTPPRAVWLASTRSPAGWTLRTVLFGVPLSSVAVAITATRHDVLTPAGWTWLGAFTAIGSALMTSLWFAAGRILIQPVVDEVVRASPDVATPTRRRTTEVSILLAVAAFSFFGLVIGAAVAGGIDDPTTRLAVLTLAAIASCAWSTFIAYELITHPLLAPLGALAESARRIGVGQLDEPLLPTSADEFGDVMIAMDEMRRGLRERERLRAAFGSYVDEGLAEHVAAGRQSILRGDEVDVTVAFLDVRGFTDYAAGVSPSEALGRLNRLFEVVVPIVREHGGHANKFLGDGLLAAFGAPEPLDDHADRAIAAAHDIADAVAATFAGSVQVGVGLNTGRVIAGTVGGGGKLEFTLIGDAVNVAARVEELTKLTGDTVLITEATLASSSLDGDDVVDRGEHRLRGTTRDLRVLAPRR